MLNKSLEKALNEQINKELFSEYLYLSMSAHFYSIDLDGFANWFEIQAKEEHDHAMKIFNFVNDKGGKVVLDKIDKPQTEFNSIEEIMSLTLEHEEKVTQSINELMDLAIKENDHSVKSFLHWFVDEQVEEESTASKLLNKVKIVKENSQGIFMLDSELAKRTYTPIPTSDEE
jgi:ferritin